MNRKKLLLASLLSVFCLQASQLPDQLSLEKIKTTQVFDPIFDDPELDRFLNPSESEEQYVYSIEQPPPPGTLLVWLRIIGVPIINAFFSVRRAVRESVAWILAKIKNDKQDAQANAQN